MNTATLSYVSEDDAHLIRRSLILNGFDVSLIARHPSDFYCFDVYNVTDPEEEWIRDTFPA